MSAGTPGQGDSGDAATCRSCGGLQYVTAAHGERAVATVCDCAADCARCGGEGHLTERDEYGYLVARDCRCGSLQERVARYNAARLPGRYHRKTLESYQHLGDNQKLVRVWLLNYRKNYRARQRGVLLMGNPGTGKTHLLVGLISHLTLERGYRCRYTDFMSLLSELKAGYNQGKGESDIIGPLARVPLLAIDELGKGRSSDWALGVLDEIISRRYNARRSTFFATNYRQAAGDGIGNGSGSGSGSGSGGGAGVGPRAGFGGADDDAQLRQDALEDRVGPRIYSRLREMCSLRVVGGPDYRTRPR